MLGGVSLEKKKRHPTVGNNVVIGAGAILLGPIKIGDSAKIGAGSVVVKSVPPGATVVGVPGRIAEKNKKITLDLEHGKLPDPVANILKEILRRQEEIEKRLGELEIFKLVERGFIHGDGI